MSKLKQLVTEIHRRSLWQVLLIYVGGGWLVFEVVQTVTEGLGLPQWFPAFAALLLLVGLPVVVATAFVREGEPEAAGSDPTLMPVGEAQTEAARKRRFPTWRNAGLSFMAALAVCGVVATGWLIFGGEGGTPPASEERPSIAVLPLVNRSGLEEDVHFTDGIHDEILTQLHKISGLSVRGRTSVMQYRGSPKNATQIGEELRARYLLEGGVQRAGDTVHINVQLIDAPADEHLWAETYNREVTVENLLSVQSGIAQRVAESLNAAVTLEELRRIEAAPTDNIEAYEYYLRGVGTNWGLAVELFDRAVTLDPSFLLPYTRLGHIHCQRYFNTRSEQRLALCETAVNRAVSINPNHPEVRFAHGKYLLWAQEDHEQALRDFEIAQQGGVDTNYFIALAEWGRGNPERGVTILTELCDTYDPRNGGVCRTACTLYLLLREYSEAERYCDRNIALLPNDIDAAFVKARIALGRSGDVKEARRLLHAIPGFVNDSGPRATRLLVEFVSLELLDRRYEEALRILASSTLTLHQSGTRYASESLLYAKVYALMDSMHMARVFYDSASAILEAGLAEWPEDGTIHSELGIAYAGIGRRDDAVRHGERAVELSTSSRYRGSQTVAALAEIYVMVNEHDAAIDQLEKHLSVPGQLSVGLLRIDPTWDPLRDHPRFRALLEKYE